MSTKVANLTGYITDCTVTAFVRVTVRLCTFIKPSKFRCVKLTITGKAVKVSLSEKQTKSEAK